MPHKRRRAAHSGIDESYWNGLDNAAKLIPAVTSRRTPNVFRITAVLHEKVEPDILQKAVDKALTIMPSFALKLHRGLFWYYFDTNSEKPVVREERGYPCAPIYKARERGFLFRVLYYKKRINFEIYHALSDGMGAMNFMQLIIYCYYNIKYGDEVPEEYIRREADKITRDFDEDSFQRASAANPKASKIRESEAFRISGYRFDGDRLGALCAILPVDGILKLAKSHDATLSEYLCALLIWSIYNTSYRRSGRQRPIVISMPVNLRGMFDSITLRNFFGQMNISVHPTREDTFETVLAATKERFRACLTREYFERQISEHVAIERIPGIRFVPVIIKDLVMQHYFKKAAKLHTCTFSNLGRVQLPPMIEKRVDHFGMLIGASQTHPKKVSLISYQNKAVLGFSSTIEDNSLEQFMLSYLADQGVEVVVSSNETPAPPKAVKNKQREVPRK